MALGSLGPLPPSVFQRIDPEFDAAALGNLHPHAKDSWDHGKGQNRGRDHTAQRATAFRGGLNGSLLATDAALRQTGRQFCDGYSPGQ
jgi:hypothetical protein